MEDAMQNILRSSTLLCLAQAFYDACLMKMHRANAFDLSIILWSLAIREVRPSSQVQLQQCPLPVCG
jgi:hypothetical protein